MPIALRRVIFLTFFVSGFCGLLYQVIWIRMAYAAFGIITPVMSVVISVFMLGLLLGSAAGGPLVKRLVGLSRRSALLFYAVAEFSIGLGAFCVPRLFSLEQHRLLSIGGMNSFGYLLLSAIAIGVALLPWCTLMGFTYPFMMAFVKEVDRSETTSFSFLYLANMIDDGRRYLMRTEKMFDVVTIDPPPPVEAAGSSLLYSVEMYALIKKHLVDGGRLQVWLPGGDSLLTAAVARSIVVSFPYVKAYQSIEGWGYHFIASTRPILPHSAAELVARMPDKARKDLLTWSPDTNLVEYMQAMLSKEVPVGSLLTADAGLMLTDERPYNEYFLLRQLAGGNGSPLTGNLVKLVGNPIRN